MGRQLGAQERKTKHCISKIEVVGVEAKILEEIVRVGLVIKPD